MTEADKRALALLVRAGRAQAVPWGMHWSALGRRIAQQTVRRLVEAGYAEHEEATVIVPTERGRTVAGSATPYLDDGLGEDDEWRVAGIDPGVDGDEPESWAPPDHRDAGGTPVAVDQAIDGDDS